MADQHPCALCGIMPAKLRCTRCKTSRYCTKEHQSSHWKEHKPSCDDAAADSASLRRAKSPLSSSVPSESEPEHISFECPICLELLFLPTTLVCGHSYCQSCIRGTLAKSEAACCPTCRQSIPADIASRLEPNRLLAAVVRASDQPRYDARGDVEDLLNKPQPVSGRPGELKWTLYVDFLSPASLVVLAVLNKLGARDRVAVVEQPMVWCDEHREPEWIRAKEADRLPRLEGKKKPGPVSASGSTGAEPPPVVLFAPAAILRAVVELWGDGRIELGLAGGGSTAEYALRVLSEQHADEVWGRLVAPVSRHFFQIMWEGRLNNPPRDATVQGLQWVNEITPTLLRQLDSPRGSVLEVAVAVPVIMLIELGSIIVQHACGALPHFRQWAEAVCQSPLPRLVVPEMKRSKHYALYKRKVKLGEMSSIRSMSSHINMIHLATESARRPGMPSGGPDFLSWPYQDDLSGMGISSEGAQDCTLDEVHEKERIRKERGGDY